MQMSMHSGQLLCQATGMAELLVQYSIGQQLVELEEQAKQYAGLVRLEAMLIVVLLTRHGELLKLPQMGGLLTQMFISHHPLLR